jgi:signal peptidase I
VPEVEGAESLPPEIPEPPPAAEPASSETPPVLTRGERLAQRRKRRTRGLVEWVVVIAVAVVIAFALRAYVVQTFYIPSDSMVPALQKNDRVIVNKLSYRLHEVHRGDIVVFTTPPRVNRAFKDLVKRVVGLPGETVEARRGRVLVNGRPIEESYLPDTTRTRDFGPVTVAPESYWVMGDNRSNSEDSRFFGAIPEDTIVGRVFVRVWPPGRIGRM